ncbi:DUF1631 family protein [Undibacterium fentianense]|uniref:DUF1631 family protein n=1 Tax=Undibacterium fentianense TaxID=2828728 RepID=A0A941E0T0_9BURK|nr:DUF1631 family protein [Undibacterium fentianense]MBR7800320.1 DUF1631 family protein [Undibacterium fentianense]
MNKGSMDHSVLLTNARVEFMRSFTEAMQRTIPRCIEDCFIKADDTYSSLEQGRLLDARTVLVEQGASIIQKLTASMEQLLVRSFKTTYSTYRPTANFNPESLTLIDPTAFEGGLRQEEITGRFRLEAEDQLRDLNIRIALIFEQEVTNERENPFRPYLFSRCISSTVEGLGVSPNLTDILVEQISNNFLSFVPSIYTAVNSYLAQNGIAAQLQLKIKKSPVATSPIVGGDDQIDGSDDNVLSEQTGPSGLANSSLPSKKVSQIEQFFSAALSRAANLMSSNQSSSDAAGQFQSNVDQHVPQVADVNYEKSQAFSWLKSGEAVGDAIRNFFRSDIFEKKQSSMQLGRSNAHNSPLIQESDLAHGGQGSQSFESDEMPSGVEFSDGNVSSPLGGSSNLTSAIPQFQRSFTPAVDQMFDRVGGLRNLILEQRSALNDLSSTVDEQMTIDVVAMLFEFILRDTQVPAEIRAQLGRLQFLVLKLALKDHSLLTQKGHPARLLVNRIGSISLGLKQIDPSGAEITKEICRIVETLLQDESENPQIFSRMLDEFDAFIARELRLGSDKTVNAIEGAEQARNRTIRFAHTSVQLHEALLGLTIDPFLQNFFETVWVYALELADRDDVKRAHRFRLLVPDLLWSIIPKANEEERAQLLALLPIILSTLKEGMASIQCDTSVQEALMNWLVDAHTKSMRISHTTQQQKLPSLSAIHHHFNRFFDDPDLQNFEVLRSESASEVTQFLDKAIKELDMKVQLLDQVYVQTLPTDQLDENLESQDAGVDIVMEQLKTGVAVEINLGGEPSQGKLNWVDPALTNLILTLEGQEQPSMLSVRMFRRMIAHGRVKFLETEPLFERAVQSLLKSADAVELPRAA